MPCYDKVNGVLRETSKIYDKVNGALREVDTGYDKVNGALREYYNNGFYLYENGSFGGGITTQTWVRETNNPDAFNYINFNAGSILMYARHYYSLTGVSELHILGFTGTYTKVHILCDYNLYTFVQDGYSSNVLLQLSTYNNSLDNTGNTLIIQNSSSRSGPITMAENSKEFIIDIAGKDISGKIVLSVNTGGNASTGSDAYGTFVIYKVWLE